MKKRGIKMKNKAFIIAMICLTIICISPIFIGQWLIQRQASASADYQKPATCNCPFPKTAEFNGTTQNPRNHPDVVAIYGTDEITIEFQDYTLCKKSDGTQRTVYAYIKSTNSYADISGTKDYIYSSQSGSPVDFMWKWAGTYTCKIVDNVTGQVICENHTYTITPAEATPVSLTINSTTPTFEGKAIEYTASWKVQTGVSNNEPVYETLSYTQANAPVSAGGFTSEKVIYKDLSFNAYASKITYDHTDRTLEEIFYNNYDLAGSDSQTASYRVLATCYSYTDSASFYSSLNRALDATKSATTATSVIAMQSFSYSYTEGETTITKNYTASPTPLTDKTYEYFTHSITGAREVGTNVTLIIPFRASSSFNINEVKINSTDQYAQDANDDGIVDDDGYKNAEWSDYVGDSNFVPSATCVNEIILNGKLTVKGSIDIAGITGTPKPGGGAKLKQGMTSGKHATITMTGGEASANGSYDKYTSIIMLASSAMRVHGYIVQESPYTWIDAQSGTIEMPFVVHDFGGGGATVALFKGNSGGFLSVSSGLLDYANSEQSNVSPFTVFEMPNIQVELHCYPSTVLNGMASLFTNGNDTLRLKARYNLTTIKMLGSSGALFNITNGKAIFKYNPEGTAAYRYTKENYIPHLDTNTKIILNGSTSSGNMSMLVNMPVLGDVEVSLAKVKFPVSQKIKLYLTGEYDYAFTTSYKFLPGSELYIQDGARVTVPSTCGLMFYSKIGSFGLYTDTYYPAAERNIPAICKIKDASLTVLGSLGGVIETNGPNSVLNLSQASSLTMTEIEGTGSYSRNGTALSFVFTQKETHTHVVQGTVVISDTAISAQPQNLVGKTYNAYKTSTELLAWFKPTAIVNLNANGGIFADGSTTTTGVVDVTLGGTTQLSINNLVPPGRENHKFIEWSLTANGSTPVDPTSILFDNDTTLYAQWREAVTASINFQSANSGNDQYAELTGSTSAALDGTFVTMIDTSKNTSNSWNNSNNPWYNYYLTGWSAVWTINGTAYNAISYGLGETVSISSVLQTLGVAENTVESCSAHFSAVWAPKTTITISGTNREVSVTYDSNSLFTKVTKGTFYLKVGDKFTAQDHEVSGYTKNPSFKINDTDYTSGTEYEIKKTGTIQIVAAAEENQNSSTCVTTGSLITLADGTQKPIEDVTFDDMLLVWDFFKGEYAAVPASAIVFHGDAYYDVVTLIFSDGTEVRTIGGHDFFDVVANEFISIHKDNVASLVGHEFIKTDGNGYSTVTLVDYTIVNEYTGSYSIFSAYHNNFIVENMLSLTPVAVIGVDRFCEYFEVGEGMKYDEEKMQADIEKYGLYTYEDFADYLTYEQYIYLNAPYYKVLVEQGYVTFEELLKAISLYIK